jgi:hypothetical protein
MKRWILFLTFLSSLASQDGFGQNSKTAAHTEVLLDTAGAVPLQNDKSKFLPCDSTKLLNAWFGPGSAGEGVWFGTHFHQALYFFIDSGKASIILHPSGKAEFANSIKINGTTTTKILTVTGGSDLAEPFPVSETDSIPAGAVVVIDEQNPGKLKLCRKTYDTRVAGVVVGDCRQRFHPAGRFAHDFGDRRPCNEGHGQTIILRRHYRQSVDAA